MGEDKRDSVAPTTARKMVVADQGMIGEQRWRQEVEEWQQQVQGQQLSLGVPRILGAEEAKSTPVLEWHRRPQAPVSLRERRCRTRMTEVEPGERSGVEEQRSKAVHILQYDATEGHKHWEVGGKLKEDHTPDTVEGEE